MPNYDKFQLSQKAKELHVVRDTFEKVCRLRDVLRFLDDTPSIRDSLGLKGGTAINLLFFNLPRLSVDIDLDFCENLSRDEMLVRRTTINQILSKHMSAEGYSINPHSKTPHSLDSFVYDYTNSAGLKDNVKIEINYSLRTHVFPTKRMELNSNIFSDKFLVNSLSPIEIYASKTVALLSRAAARDLYDMNYMIKYGLFDETETEQYRKCVIFYLAITTITPPTAVDFSAIELITPHKVQTDLKPVVRDRDTFDLDTAKKRVLDFLINTICLSEYEMKFFVDFKRGFYHPQLLFDDQETLHRIEKHPMAIWKTAKNRTTAGN